MKKQDRQQDEPCAFLAVFGAAVHRGADCPHELFAGPARQRRG